MVHAIRLVGLKDREGRLSQVLAGKARFRKIIGSRHAATCHEGIH
jgi:hypothetical protein